jgi:hypothetical protein
MSLLFSSFFWFVCVSVCSMARVNKFIVFTSLKNARLRDHCQFLDPDGVLLLLHSINTNPDTQTSFLYNGYQGQSGRTMKLTTHFPSSVEMKDASYYVYTVITWRLSKHRDSFWHICIKLPKILELWGQMLGLSSILDYKYSCLFCYEILWFRTLKGQIHANANHVGSS